MTTYSRLISPIRAAGISPAHAAILESVKASVKILNIDVDLSKSIDVADLDKKLSKCSNLHQRMSLKRGLELLGCLS